MLVSHETGHLTAPVPIYFETFSPANPTGRPTVVMVHGGAHTGACYQRTADDRRGWAYLFAERGYRVAVPDWPGTGRSGYIPTDKLGGATVIEGLGALIRHLGPPVVLLTHSMSGCYGWPLLERHGDVIAALVGVAPGPPGNIQAPACIYAETDAAIEIDHGGRRVRIDKNAPLATTQDFVEHKLVGDSSFFPRDRLANYAATLRAIPPRIVLERQNVHGSQMRVNDPDKLRGKRVLVITGTHDLDHPREVDGAIVDWLRGHGADADFCFLGDRGIVGNGHMLMMEQNSDDIAGIIIAWLEAAPPPR